MATAYRFDASNLGKVEITSEGYLRAQAVPTRAGILLYKDSAGNVRRELRPEDEVFAPASLASLSWKPLTDDHPGLVTAKNVKSLRVGSVVTSPERAGDMVHATVQVEDSDTVDKITSGALKELSCGYTCTYDPTPGTWRGQKYDGVQRGIRYNHLALLPAGAGRAGSACALRLDGAEENADLAAAVVADAIEGTQKTMKIGDKELHLDAADELVLTQVLADYTASKAKLEQDLVKVQAERDAAKAQAEQLQIKADAAELASKRIALEHAASLVVAQDWAGKSDAEVQAAVIAKVFPSIKLDGKDATYLSVMFDAACSTGEPTKTVPASVKQDGGEKPVSEYDQMVARRRAQQSK